MNDADIVSFWHNEFDKLSPRLQAEVVSPVLNKVGLFNTNNNLRNIVGQSQNSLRLGHIMDTGKILIANLSKGQLGEEAASLLGSMLITSIQLAAIHRASNEIEKRRPFYLYIDECHCFMTLAFSTILSEARKYGLSLFLTHQYIEQLDEKIRAAIFGNVGTIISFRVGATDAEYLAKEFYPVFAANDFVSLPRYSIYLKLMIDGTVSEPFSATTFPATI